MDYSSQFWHPFVHQSPFLNSSGPLSFLLLFVITIAAITAGSGASVSKSASLTKRFCSFLLRENNFTSCHRAAIFNFTAKNALDPISFYFAAHNSSHCSSVEIRLVIRSVFTLDA